MFKHRRARVASVLLISWAALTAVERWAEQTPWSAAVKNGALWSCVVAVTWWFAEMTQGRSSRSDTAHEAGRSSTGGKPGEPAISASPPPAAAEPEAGAQERARH
jgi:hypothetical protein